MLKRKQHIAYLVVVGGGPYSAVSARNWTTKVCSVEGLIGHEAKNPNWRTTQSLSQKWDHTYSSVCGYTNTQISTALARETHINLWVYCVLDHQMSCQQLEWLCGSVMGLFRY